MVLRSIFTILICVIASGCTTTRDEISVRSNSDLSEHNLGPENDNLNSPARRISGKAPIYPLSLALSGKEGESVIVFTVGVDGRTKNFKVEKATDERYANHAIIALKEWIFDPARRDGIPVDSRIRQTFKYGF